MEPTNPAGWLKQSLWLDNINRELLDSGTLARYIKELQITGLTSNPTIFDEALAEGSAYDSAIRNPGHEGLSDEALFMDLALDDLTRAADLFRPIHVESDGMDGWVSMEVSPLLAHDAVATVAAALAIQKQAGRPNLFVKIPGTREGLVAIEEAIFLGVPVNVTLLFSREQYLAAASAYLRAIERRIAGGLDAGVASVASLFVSRWDRAANSRLPAHLHNRLGIAVAGCAYRAYSDSLASPRWLAAAARGARVQRLLWASTGTKDPGDSKTLYAEALDAAGTIDTMPERTLAAYSALAHRGPGLSLDTRVAQSVLDAASDSGLDVARLGEELQQDGAKAFSASWTELLGRLRAKRKSLGAASIRGALP